MSAATFSVFASRPLRKTIAPTSANASAMAIPRPRDAPVTSATRLLRSPIAAGHLLLRIKGEPKRSESRYATAALGITVCRTSKPSNLGCSR
jgi:hypothetical protein